MRPESSARPTINVTPLVDVVLVLLIIFMVITPEMENQDRVELPSVMFPDPEAKAKVEPLRISLSRHQLSLDGEAITWGELDSRFAEIRIAEPQRRAVVRADVSVSYGEVRRIYAACESHRFPGIAVAVSERPEKEVPDSLAIDGGEGS